VKGLGQEISLAKKFLHFILEKKREGEAKDLPEYQFTTFEEIYQCLEAADVDDFVQ